MFLRFIAATLALCVLLTATPDADAELRFIPNPQATNEDLRFLDDLIQGYAESINQEIVNFPTVAIGVTSCGQPNAFYRNTPEHGPTIAICSELLGATRNAARAITSERDHVALSMVSQLMFITLHEVGHALIDVLDLPVLGREEDAADQFATFLLESSPTIVVYSLTFWSQSLAQRRTPDLAAFAGEHGLDQQRIFNMLCWSYGADPLVRHQLAELIPANRRGRCAGEANDMTRSWSRTLSGHLTGEYGTTSSRRGSAGTWRFTDQLQRGNSRCTASGTFFLSGTPFAAGTASQVGTCIDERGAPMNNDSDSLVISSSETTSDGFVFTVVGCEYRASYTDATRLAVSGTVQCGDGHVGDFYAVR